MRPLMAILSHDTLAVMGLKQMLQSVMPAIEVEAFGTVDDLRESGEERFMHFFVYVSILLTDRPYFLERRKKTIVLTTHDEHANQFSDFHCLKVTVPEKTLVKSLLLMVQHAHRHPIQPVTNKSLGFSKTISPREVDVLRLIVKGYINKEIADRLNIGLTTVITHRKNIMEKLAMRSVSALTIYAVMNGYVSIEEI